MQGSLSAAVPLYIFGAASSLAGVVAALGLTESLGHPLPNSFEVTTDQRPHLELHSIFDNQTCLGLGEDEGEREAYLEVHLAKEEEGEKEEGGGGGGVESSSRESEKELLNY